MLVHLAPRIKMAREDMRCAGCMSSSPPVSARRAACSAVRAINKRGKIAPSAIHLQRGNKSFLRDVDLAELPHLLFAFLLLLQKFSFTRDVAAIALGGDVLAQRAHG